ncbi:tRNA epoxyqueuosine(34) reductase QueG [Dongia soli]|uniref:Epoxyqueuosine reductase n=1 Tax=Dongia soli TaxID=600628 RepID=A0ABU5EG92_9PROT|nr:tRNA epoxyqueuosine(34) reductase QueG [Dongia soli]MDY0885347.1 tRNA epoxyqueuosine(34) reductase QueG [Dongia soli]
MASGTLASKSTGDPRAEIRAEALALGFDAIGFAHAELAEATRAELAAFIAEGRHGDMGWLADKADRRGDPKELWPEASTVIVLGVNYGPNNDPFDFKGRPQTGNISVYARHRDYHDTIKKRLKALGRWMAERYGCGIKVFVDTAPVMEKSFAEAAGLGWQGKHTNLVSRDFGSWLFLGEIFTTLDLGRDDAEEDHCGGCHRCLDICPTQAFTAPYRIDARRCISYLTIEHKGSIPRELRPLMGNRIYGCDDCLAICPWNKFARPTSEKDFLPRQELTAPRLAELAALDDASFRQFFTASPIKRIGRDRFLRNVLIAIGNSGCVELADSAIARLQDASALVRGAAIWAASRLLPRHAVEKLAADQLSAETDEEVRAEWRAALHETPGISGLTGAEHL